MALNMTTIEVLQGGLNHTRIVPINPRSVHVRLCFHGVEKLVQDPVEHRVKLQKKRQWTTPAVTEIFIEEGRISTAAVVEG